MAKIISIRVDSIESLSKYKLSERFIESLKPYIKWKSLFLCLDKDEPIWERNFYANPHTEVMWILTDKKA
jgi:hypothetical protein